MTLRILISNLDFAIFLPRSRTLFLPPIGFCLTHTRDLLLNRLTKACCGAFPTHISRDD